MHLAEVGELGRILAFLCTGIIVLVVSWGYQRLERHLRQQAAAADAASERCMS